jgi:hypothetical protein
MCCYSGGAVGSVKTASLEDIWNGALMVGIRESPISGDIPAFCKEHGASCPLVLEAKKALEFRTGESGT